MSSRKIKEIVKALLNIILYNHFQNLFSVIYTLRYSDPLMLIEQAIPYIPRFILNPIPQTVWIYSSSGSALASFLRMLLTWTLTVLSSP